MTTRTTNSSNYKDIYKDEEFHFKKLKNRKNNTGKLKGTDKLIELKAAGEAMLDYN